MKQHYLRLIILLLTVPLFSVAHAARYTYDKLHRLTAVTYDGGDSVYYKYDPAGNLLSSASSYKIGGTLTDAEGNPLAGAVLSRSSALPTMRPVTSPRKPAWTKRCHLYSPPT